MPVPAPGDLVVQSTIRVSSHAGDGSGGLSPAAPPLGIVPAMEGVLASLVAPAPATDTFAARFAWYADVLRRAVQGAEAVLGETWGADLAVPFGSIPHVNGGWSLEDGATLALAPPPGALTVFAAADADLTYYVSVVPPAAFRSDLHTCDLELRAPEGARATGAALFLSHTRSFLAAVTPLGYEGGCGCGAESRGGAVQQPARIGQRTRTVWPLEFPRALQPGEPVRVRVAFRGDPPHVRAQTWLAPDGPVPECPRAGPFEEPPALVRADRVALLARYERSPAQVLERREAIVEGLKGEERAAHAFFLELDRTTSPGMDIESALAKELERLSSNLAFGYLRRAELHAEGRALSFTPDELADWGAGARRVAAHIEGLLCEHFSGGSGGIDFDQVEGAFERFAGGQLVEFDTHGTPNGVNYFCFAELAILMRELEARQDVWARLLPIFARTSEIYATAFHQCSGPRTRCAYRVVHNPDGARGHDAGERAALRAAWADLDPVHEYTRVVHAALEHELPLPAPGSPQVAVEARVLPDHGC